MTLQPKQTTQQRLIFAPNVTLALEVLRMPAMELQVFLQTQLGENPLLEIEEPDGDAQPGEEALEATDNDRAAAEEFAEDWLGHWASAGEWQAGEAGSDLEMRGSDRTMAVPASLRESVRTQLGCLALPDAQRRLAEVIIYRLDDNGYLDGSLEELATELGEQPAHLEATLRLIQRCDPPGVGARDLRECLMLQLQQRGQTDTLAFAILRDHFACFAQCRLRVIAKTTGHPLPQVEQACEQLRALNPKPGLAFCGDIPPDLVPDLIIRHREQHYDAELNDESLPRLMINRTYYRMLRDPHTPPDAREFLTTKFKQASWIIRSIDERNATLLAIGRCLISLQRNFVEHGPRAIIPLTQAQVARLIGRHPSTVSRAIAGKTIDTPYGIFRLDQLFASQIRQTDETRQVSDEQIKSDIQRLIAEEDPRHPLSDAALANRLAQRKIAVARRTIAKYRTALRVLPAHLRRHRR